MFAQVGPRVRQQLGQLDGGAIVEHGAQRMHRRDGGDLVVVTNRPGQHQRRVRSPVLTGRDHQVVRGAQGVKDERRLSHLCERRLQGHE